MSQDLNAMLREHEPFLRSRVMRWIANLPHLAMHEEDLVQEGRVALWRAAARFDEGRGVTFLTFAGQWVDHLMRNFVQRKSNLVRFPRGKPIGMVFLDAPTDAGDEQKMQAVISFPVDEESAWAVEDAHVRLMAGFEAVLTAREKAVLWAVLVEGRTQRALAPEWGVTHTMIQQVVAKGTKKLRGWMERPAVLRRGEAGTNHGLKPELQTKKGEHDV
jgi:RNA polymerase sigma factor (sigma-70 family)